HGHLRLSRVLQNPLDRLDDPLPVREVRAHEIEEATRFAVIVLHVDHYDRALLGVEGDSFRLGSECDLHGAPPAALPRWSPVYECAAWKSIRLTAHGPGSRIRHREPEEASRHAEQRAK